MAMLFGRMGSVSRGAGKSAMKAAAYRSCSKLSWIITDKETGLTFDITSDYSNKKGLVFSQIFAPDIELTNGIKAESPGWVYDRQSLWQRIEDIETRVNSELAKEYVVALPKEFSIEQNTDLLKEFVESSFVSRGMVVDVNFHADNPDNPHAHIMFPMRMLVVNEQGEIDFGGKMREWTSFALLKQIKEEQKLIINNHYERNGFEYKLEWGTADGLESTFHHGGIKNLWLRNQEILERNASRIIADPSLVIDKLDHNKPVFTREDIEKEIEKALQLNIRNIKSEEYEEHKKSLDMYLESEKLKMLNTVLLSPKLTVVNGCDLKGRVLFAKTKQVELEKRFISHVEELNSRMDHVINIRDKDIEPLAKDKDGKITEFTAQQKEVIRKTLSGKNISIIEGWPGAGKSTVTKEIVRHYKSRGYNVIAAAPTNKAAQELEDKLGCKAYTAAALRMKWQFDRGFKTDIFLRSDYYKEESYQNIDPVMSERTVLIMDEISMIDLATFDYFTKEVVSHGCKLIGLGDNNQNHSIGTKGAAAKAIEIGGSNLLTEINRHKNENEEIRDLHIEASKALSNYQVVKALSIYAQLGAIRIHDNEELKEQAIFSAYMEQLFEISKDENISVSDAASKIGMIAYTNAEIDRLNEMVRGSLKRSGVLSAKGSSFLSGGIHGSGSMVELCEGDRIIFKSNQKEEDGYGGVMNNEIATVKKIITCSESGKGEFVAEIDRKGERKKVLIKSAEKGRPISFKHAYAITNYAVQGADIDNILMSIDKNSGYEVNVVGLTRHKKQCIIFAAQDTLEDEVYRTKDLDVNKVRDEYIAISYKLKECINDKGDTYFEKEDVPLWKLGLGLLGSKRSNLNFAIDHQYGNSNQVDKDNLAAIYWGLGLLRRDSEKHEAKIYEFELKANSEVGLGEGLGDGAVRTDGDRDGDRHKEKEKDLSKYSWIELFANEHFKFRAGDIFFDARSVMKSLLRYEEINIDEICVKDHVDALKVGILKNGERLRLRWSELSDIDQNLILHSYLDEEDRRYLGDQISKLERLEGQIKEVASEHVFIIDELNEGSKSSHKDLEGNYVLVKDYLEARVKVRECYKRFTEVESVLCSFRFQKLMIAEIKKKYGVELVLLDVDIASIKRAETKFLKMKEESDEKKGMKDSNFKATSDIEKYRENYLRSIVKRSKDISKDERRFLFVVDILRGGNNKELSTTWSDAEKVESELEEAKKEREAKARVLLDQYHDKSVGQVSISKILSQLNLNYHTISKHARVCDERHYFEEIGKGTIAHAENYESLMKLVERCTEEELSIEDGKSVLKCRDELAISNEAMCEYLEELKSQRSSIMEDRNNEIKSLQEDRLFRLTEFNSYIGSIYKTNRLDVIENLDNMLEKASDKKQLLLAICESPEMIGELDHRGIISKIFRTKEARDLEDRLEIFGENLKRYVDGYERIGEMQSKLDGQIYEDQIGAIDLEISKLQSQLASKQETEMLSEISRIELEHSNGSKINEEKFASSISELFREDRVLDLLLNWHRYKAKIEAEIEADKCQELGEEKVKESGKESGKGQEKRGAHSEGRGQENSYHEKRERLDFEEVSKSLNSSDYESIFRRYASYINTDGKISKKGDTIVCGSLNMNLKNGLWMRFSSGESGNIFGFIANARGVDKKDALEIVADMAGIRSSVLYIDKGPIKVAEQIKQSEHRLEMKEEWVSVGVVPKNAQIFNPKQDIGFKLKANKLTEIYEYRNKENELLGYTVRLEDKESGKKQVMPVAYCYNEKKEKYAWHMKGFSDNGFKPIYGAEKLNEEIKVILIVEGEKTAKAAQKLLPDHIVISWIGGSQAVDKVNSEVLRGREVVIWPDNDIPGVKAANNIKEHIDIANGHKGLCSIVDTGSLDLPEKWDLADDIPKGVDVKCEISKSLNEGYNMEDIKQYVKPEENGSSILESFDLLKAKGEIDIDEPIHSVGIYKKSVGLIIDKEGMNNKLESVGIVKVIEDAQEKYNELRREYDHRYSDRQEGNQGGSKVDIIGYELRREASIFYQLKTNVRKLTAIDKDHIDDTVKNLVVNMKQHKESDIKYVGKLLDSKIELDVWNKELSDKHQAVAKVVRTVRIEAEARKAEQELFVKSELAKINIDKSRTTNSDELLSIIVRELALSRSYNESDIERFTLAVECNQKQGVKEDKELMTIVSEANLSLHDKTRELEVEANRNRTKYLTGAYMHTEVLKKLGKEIDRDKMVNTIKGMSYEERESYLDDLVGRTTLEHVKPYVEKFAEEKLECTHIDKSLNLLEKEHEFFMGMSKNYRVGAYLSKDDELIDRMKSHEKFYDETRFSRFKAMVSHVSDFKIEEHDLLNERLKSNNNIHELKRDLEEKCREYHRNEVNSNLDVISKHQLIRIEHHEFKDARSYLTHVKQSPSFRFMDEQHVVKLIEHHDNLHKQEQHQQQQHELNQQRQLARTMDGPHM